MNSIKTDVPVEITGFSKTYGTKIAVDRLDLKVNEGEVFGFLGPNGAGKSTTIRSILNFLTPSDGKISIFGLDSVKNSVAIKNHIGYLAGDISLYDSMSGYQLFKYLTGLGKNTNWDYVNDLANRLQISPQAKIGTLSKGNKQKIGLIQAFMHQPKLLILDEPTSGLDPLMKQVFYEMVLQMKHLGNSVFVSSHDLNEVQHICDKAAFIKSGRLIATENIRGAFEFSLRRYTITFPKLPELSVFEKIESVSEVTQDENKLTVTVKGDISEFIKTLSDQDPIDLSEEETSLEDIFMKYYED
ncbi:MAG: ABC transporter ATP-binding protein [SAR202 cluster bacterium]|jgi:ABC-2 type transport system ATP-binding protein|nr:ABC transporter ATP-binding protein [SAR202 cluster bacterium]|tara:strand:- start:10179 stop:11078 length:900 start_codon:yes stop_codon:yes gene_type:complete